MNGQVSAKIVKKEYIEAWVNDLRRDYEVHAPVTAGKVSSFRRIESAAEVDWNYSSTTIPPSKIIYAPQQALVRFVKSDKGYKAEEDAGAITDRALLAVHPCDLHGLLVLERTFLGQMKDAAYERVRSRATVVGLNCQNVGEKCFCASFGTGPFFGFWMQQGPPFGCDAILTDLGERFLVETFGEKGDMLFVKVKSSPPSLDDIGEKFKREAAAKERFRKTLNTRDLPALMRRNLYHPTWRITGEGKCLSCANCTNVCPTCFCYDTWDKAQLDLSVIERVRRWDSCQDERFAEVHGGNFRSTREARLRQFVCHKLSYWVEQYGCFGCVGCGRCMTWCPTGIDLTEIAAEIRTDEERK
jgi:hypothetical protein